MPQRHQVLVIPPQIEALILWLDLSSADCNAGHVVMFKSLW